MKNIAFLPNTEELRIELYTLGLSLHAVKVNSQSFLMIETADLSLIKKLALKHNCGKIYISDSRRALFEVTCCDKFIPSKLGTLARSLSQDSSSSNPAGAFCLVVYDNNQNYYYSVQ